MTRPRIPLALLVFGAALVASGCATRGSRSLAGSRAAEPAVAVRPAPPSAYPNAGPTGLSRFARLRTDTPDYVVYEPPPRVVFVPSGDYGPTGVYGDESPYVVYGVGGIGGVGGASPWGYAPGGWVPGGSREPYDPARDPTGLASAVLGASPYHNPGDRDGEVTRPGLSTGSGVFAHHDDPPAPSPSHDHGSHHGR